MTTTRVVATIVWAGLLVALLVRRARSTSWRTIGIKDVVVLLALGLGLLRIVFKL